LNKKGKKGKVEQVFEEAQKKSKNGTKISRSTKKKERGEER